MTTEWIAVVVAMVAVGVTITIAVVSGFSRLGDRIDAVDQRLGDRIAALEQRVGGVEQRVSYLAGLIEGRRGAPQGGSTGGGPEPPATDKDAA